MKTFKNDEKPVHSAFYSQLAKAVGSAPARMSGLAGDQWAAWLAGNAAKLGVKQAEIEWSGIGDWLALQSGKVFKDGVLEYLEGNGVRVGEVILGSADDAVSALNKRLAGSGYTAIAEEGTNDDLIL